VTFTSDATPLDVDAAVVLQHSVRMTQSRHEVDMVAIVHPGVVTGRPALERLGFRIMEFEPPIRASEGQHLRETIDQSGCCGALELLELCAWSMTEYDRVLAMNPDTLVLRNMDEIFERDMPPGAVAYTFDHAMDNMGSRMPPVRTGFLLMRPSVAVYEHLVEIVRVGDFRPGTGWGGLNIGWCWGGQTVSGLLSYFSALEPHLGYALPPCQHSAMLMTQDCLATPFASVYSIHYTLCLHPWECRLGAGKPCAEHLHAWWMVRADLERANHLEPSGRCCRLRDSDVCQRRDYAHVPHERMALLPMTPAEPLSPDAYERIKRKSVVVMRDDLPHDGQDRNVPGGPFS